MKRTTILLLISASQGVAAAAPATGMDNAALHNMLVQDCGSCHGLRMKGGLGPALLPQNLEGKPMQLLVDTILDGRPGTAMPPWRGLLTEQDASWMVERLRSGL